jgi:hypothetical protein
MKGAFTPGSKHNAKESEKVGCFLPNMRVQRQMMHFTFKIILPLCP